jgi:hypothetical protein
MAASLKAFAIPKIFAAWTTRFSRATDCTPLPASTITPDTALLQVRAASGRLEVVELSAHGGGALAPQELMQQQLHQVSLAASQKAAALDAVDSSSEAASATPSTATADLAHKPAFSCNTCAGDFADAAEHRAHFK